MPGAKHLVAAVALAVAAACAHAPPHPESAERVRRKGVEQRAGAEVGLASYYGAELQGHRTASGSRFDKRALTCAHRSAPFGTRLRVTDLSSGRSVIVTVTDRGPYNGGRIVDLSLGAARALGIVGRGVARVRVERLPD